MISTIILAVSVVIIVILLLYGLKLITESIQNSMSDVRNQITSVLNTHSSTIDTKLTTTLTDVVKRLAIIDEAQKKMTDLSSNIMGLQEILSDKRTRGAFGEVQLSMLLHNVLPTDNFVLQHTLSNNKRVDCILLLPQPTGNIAVDAKFPLENYQKLADHNLNHSDRTIAQQQFRSDIKKHIQDIAEKYIIPGETSDSAMMFIPAEAIFAEIHSNYPDLVELSHRSKVWLVSPTTFMAILTTARAVIKDAATKKQIHIIQENLLLLSKDFERFQDRMDNLAKHINQANEDVTAIHISSRKISSKFNSIEQVDL